MNSLLLLGIYWHVLAQSAPEKPCQSCHGSHGQSLARIHAGIVPRWSGCQSCHEPGHSKQPAHLHEFEHGPFALRSCDICHESPAEGKEAALPDKSADLCLECHTEIEDLLGSAKFRHRALDLAEHCQACHSPHATPFAKQLWLEETQLCLRCHSDIRLQKDVKSHRHQPVFEGRCTICHDPHASQTLRLLRRPVNQLCLACHGQFLPQGREQISLFDGAVELPVDFFNGMRVILPEPSQKTGHPFAKHPISGAYGSQKRPLNCLTCHRPHAGDGTKLLVTEKAPKSELCLRCHGGRK